MACVSGVARVRYGWDVRASDIQTPRWWYEVLYNAKYSCASTFTAGTLRFYILGCLSLLIPAAPLTTRSARTPHRDERPRSDPLRSPASPRGIRRAFGEAPLPRALPRVLVPLLHSAPTRSSSAITPRKAGRSTAAPSRGCSCAARAWTSPPRATSPWSPCSCSPSPRSSPRARSRADPRSTARSRSSSLRCSRLPTSSSSRSGARAWMRSLLPYLRTPRRGGGERGIVAARDARADFARAASRLALWGYRKLVDGTRSKRWAGECCARRRRCCSRALLLLVPIRGGVQWTPLNPSSTYFSHSDFANQAGLNVAWNFLHSLTLRDYRTDESLRRRDRRSGCARARRQPAAHHRQHDAASAAHAQAQRHPHHLGECDGEGDRAARRTAEHHAALRLARRTPACSSTRSTPRVIAARRDSPRFSADGPRRRMRPF